MTRQECPGGSQGQLSPRGLLKATGAIAAGSCWAPTIVRASSRGADGSVAPSNRINIGMIGLGRQTIYTNLRSFLSAPDCQVVALCDVDRWRLDITETRMPVWSGGISPAEVNGIPRYTDFRELLARRDIDAVMISTPDHWHVPMSVAAVQGGKHVCCEKPLARSIAEGRLLSDVVTKHNCQNPLLVLPNLYFFGRAAANLYYLDEPDRQVLADLAAELGDAAGVLPTAWCCLKLSLSELPGDLAHKVRGLRLDTDLAKSIPGGPARYVEILAAQVDSRRALLETAAEKPGTAAQAAESLANGAAALLRWWHIHRYVGMGRRGDLFQWAFIHPSEVGILTRHAKECTAAGPDVMKIASARLAAAGLLSRDEALARLKELTR